MMRRIVSSILILMFVAGASFMIGVRWQRHVNAKLELVPYDLDNHEKAAIEMIHIGVLDFIWACGYETGSKNMNRDVSHKACMIDLGVDQPPWPRDKK